VAKSTEARKPSPGKKPLGETEPARAGIAKGEGGVGK